ALKRIVDALFYLLFLEVQFFLVIIPRLLPVLMNGYPGDQNGGYQHQQDHGDEYPGTEGHVFEHGDSFGVKDRDFPRELRFCPKQQILSQSLYLANSIAYHYMFGSLSRIFLYSFMPNISSTPKTRIPTIPKIQLILFFRIAKKTI